MTERFFEQVGRLEEIIAKGPTSCIYERDLAELLSNPSLNEYFFRQLADPEWLGILVKAGKFKSVPDPQENEAEKTIAFPFWPEGEYLKKIAPVVPGQVCKIVAELPPTRNARAHDSMLDIALAVTPEQAVEVVPKAIEGIRSPFHVVLPLKIGSLICALAKARQESVALQLAEAALEIVNDARLAKEKASESHFSNLGEPTGRFDLWHYEQILTKCMPDLVEAFGGRALELLCELLDRAILLSDVHGAERRPNDLSQIWRPAIEEHQQNLNMGVKHLLVTAVRNGAEQIARNDRESALAITLMLEGRGQSWLVFRRIALHLIRVYADSTADLLRDRLVNREYFDSVELRHEYFLLEQECFGRLSSEDQRVILAWIDEGPKYTPEQLKRWEEFTGRPWTEQDKTAYVRQWKRDHLLPLEGQLDAKWKKAYAELQSLEGKSEHPEFTSYHERGAWGPRSPQGQDNLVKLSPRDLVDYLTDWKPTGEWFRGASPEGLGRELTTLIASDPVRYSVDAAEFRRLSEPTYVRAIVQGFHDALKQKKKFSWPSVLDLCVWAVRQEREIPGRNVVSFEMDAHWGWTRAAVSRLLTDGFSSAENPIPFELRETVWQGIEVGTHDPEPTPEQEKGYFERAAQDNFEDRKGRGSAKAFDPFTNSMNTTRGVAMEAVVRYALWVRSRFEKSVNKELLLGQGFDAMPEVREVLDFHLSAKNDPSVTIRTIYGQRSPWLQLLDEKWAVENQTLIFARKNQEYWHAAWDTYIGFTPPYDNVLEWLKDEYEFAVDQIGTHNHGWAQPQAPDYSLVQHLMSFYWRGKLQYESDIISNFYRRADANLRGHALNFIGRTLRNAKEPIPSEIVDRVKKLWEKRVEVVRKEPEASGEELKEYGWWFASSKLDDDWSIAQLLKALSLAKRVEPDHLVVERLVDIARTMPLQAIQALRMMIDGDTKGWGILGWSDKAKEIIRNARMSGDSVARLSAEELVNLLGSRGHFDFGDLLKEPSN